MAEPFSIAVAQTCPIAGDVAANLLEHIRLAEIAGKEGVDLVLFPELSLTGYEIPLGRKLAFSLEDQRLEPLRVISREKNLTLIAGGPFQEGPSLFLGGFIFSPQGAVTVYTKQRLGAFPPDAACDSLDGAIPPPENSIFRAGTLNPLPRIKDAQIALAICADIGDPNHAARASGLGADIYLASMFVIPSDFPGDSRKLAGYAKGHGMLVGLANYGAPSGGLRAAGRSGFWSNTGESLLHLPEGGSGLAILRKASSGYSVKKWTQGI